MASAEYYVLSIKTVHCHTLQERLNVYSEEQVIIASVAVL